MESVSDLMPGSQSSRVSLFRIGGCKAIKNTAVGAHEEVCSVPGLWNG